ncbi:MAG: amino acid permease [Verrucomicrobia bacterium]|nr:amino acid permease [Verrucomicrobiota bacterium]
MNDSHPPQETSRASVELVRSLGVFATTMFVVGNVIGSGVFAKPGIMASQVGSPGWLLAVWVVAGTVSLIGALANAEVAAMIPEAGGQYIFFHRMYGPFPAFLFGWSLFAILKTGSLASLAFIFAEAFGQLVNLPQLPNSVASFAIHLPFMGDVTPLANFGVKSVAAALIVTLTAINCFGIKPGSLVQNIFAVAKMTALFGIIALAFFTPGAGHAANLTTASATIDPHGWLMWAAFAAALQGAFWAYDGWNDVTFIAGEVKNPQSVLPRGLITGMIIVIAIYLLASLAYVYVLPIDELAKSKLAAADLAERCFRGGGKWIAVGIMISTFGAANSNVLAPARVVFSMARRNAFPQFLGRVHPRFHAPTTALIVQGAWSLLLLFSGTFDTITNTLIFVAWIFYGAATAGVFVLRHKEPNTPRPYKVPGYPVLPAVFVIFATAFLVFEIIHDVRAYQIAAAAGKPAIINCAFGLFLVFIGTPIYFLCRRRTTAGPPR